ncbi:alkaline phosphatase PafA [Wenyingzhuangia sp. IMCC45533]
MKKIASVLLLLGSLQVFAQNKPKLVVGIVIDQMRYDYLLRFKDKFGTKGFNKLIKEGVNFENAHYNYIPTYTAVGHTSIYTGTTPKNHGIIGNNWYDKFIKKSIYVVDDLSYQTIGSKTRHGKKSPKRLVASTVADQLKMAQNFKGKTIGVAIKDRSAILPVGHTANIAYWFDGGNEGKWISSSFYQKKLPQWVIDFNIDNKSKLDYYLSSDWDTSLLADEYHESADDEQYFEGKFKNEEKSVFPHHLPTLKKDNGNYSILKSTPYGNTMTLDFATKIINNEQLGRNSQVSDFLAISLSSTDYIGHQYGPASKEIEDTYIKLNDDLDDFIKELDKQVGYNNYVLFITSDHAVAQIPHYLKDHKVPSGYFKNNELLNKLNEFTLKKFKSKQLIENISNHQIFLNKGEIRRLSLSLINVENQIIDELILYQDIYKVISANTLQKTEFVNAPYSLLQEGYNQKISGDILYTLKPSILSNGYIKGGTTHGSGYNYDTHVPIIFYGGKIAKGKSVKKEVTIVQIAPTLANLLEIQEPNMSSHKILTEVFKD